MMNHVDLNKTSFDLGGNKCSNLAKIGIVSKSDDKPELTSYQFFQFEWFYLQVLNFALPPLSPHTHTPPKLHFR